MNKSVHRFLPAFVVLMIVSLVLSACGNPAAATPTVPAATSTTSSTGGATPTVAPVQPSATTSAVEPTKPAVEPTKAPTTPATGGKILKVHQPIYPENLDPHVIADSQEIAVLLMAYEGLTKLNTKLEVVGGAAEKWEFSSDFTQVTYTLRPGLKYSDGTPLTSKDFERAVRRTLSSAVAGGYNYTLFDIKGGAELAGTPMTDTVALEKAEKELGVSTPDDQHIVFQLNGPAPYFPAITSLWVMYPVKEASIKSGADWYLKAENHIGNGPYIISKIEPNSKITFAPNSNYWEGKPKIDGMEYVYISDLSVAFEAYKRGEVDTLRPDSSDLPAIASDPVLSKEMLKYPQAATSDITFNLDLEPFNDPKVRQAFAYAFDRQTFCDVIRNGGCTAALSWIPQGIPGSYQEDRFGFDPVKAKATLAESSYGGPEGLPEVKLSYPGDNPALKPRMEWVASQFQEILGVNVIPEPIDTKTFIGMTNDHETYPQMSFSGWGGDYPDPQNWISVIWACAADAAQNYGYCNKDLDTIIEAADSELDPAKRIELYIQAGKMVVADQPAIFGYNPISIFLVKPYVTGYSTSASDIEWPGEWTSLLTIDIKR